MPAAPASPEAVLDALDKGLGLLDGDELQTGDLAALYYERKRGLGFLDHLFGSDLEEQIEALRDADEFATAWRVYISQAHAFVDGGPPAPWADPTSGQYSQQLVDLAPIADRLELVNVLTRVKPGEEDVREFVVFVRVVHDSPAAVVVLILAIGLALAALALVVREVRLVARESPVVAGGSVVVFLLIAASLAYVAFR